MSSDVSISTSDSHRIHVYTDEASRTSFIGDFLYEGLRRRERVFALVTRETGEDIVENLIARTSKSMVLAFYTSIDADEMLAALRAEPKADTARFLDMLSTRFGKALHPGLPARVCEELGTKLWLAGLQDVALRLEECWQLLAKQGPLSVLCPYSLRAFRDSKPFLDLCAHHTHVSFVSTCRRAAAPCPV